MESSSNFVLLLLLTIGVVVTIVRILAIVYQRSNPKSSQPLSSLIVLGSGGHTAEMLNLLNVLPMERFKPRFYIAAATDNMSLQKARVYEDSLLDKVRVGSSKSNAILEDPTRVRLHFWRVRAALSSTWLSVLCIARLSVIGVDAVGRAEFMQIYRSREVGQSYITSIGTTTIAMAHALWLMIKIRPKVILCNGPGTCIPLCVIAFFFKVLGIRWSSIFYVESIARVRRLSLSGLLLYKLRIVDQLFVQWPQLKEKYPRAHYVGCLM